MKAEIKFTHGQLILLNWNDFFPPVVRRQATFLEAEIKTFQGLTVGQNFFILTLFNLSAEIMTSVPQKVTVWETDSETNHLLQQYFSH